MNKLIQFCRVIVLVFAASKNDKTTQKVQPEVTVFDSFEAKGVLMKTK